MLQNCYHSQGINKGRQLEQGGFSLKTHLPLSCKKQIPHSLTFVYNFSSIFTIHTIFWMPSQWGFFVCFLGFKGQALKLSIIKAKRVWVDEGEGKVLHTFTPLQVLQTPWSNEQAKLIYPGKWLVWIYMNYSSVLQWFITNNHKKIHCLDVILSLIQAQSKVKPRK